MQAEIQGCPPFWVEGVLGMEEAEGVGEGSDYHNNTQMQQYSSSDNDTPYSRSQLEV